MNTVLDQMLAAYERESELYSAIEQLVAEQRQCMATAPDPRLVVDLCARIEATMNRIAAIETALEVPKATWEKTRHDPEGRLAGALDAIRGAIERISSGQAAVQQALLDYTSSERARSEGARTAINTRRASHAYSAG